MPLSPLPLSFAESYKVGGEGLISDANTNTHCFSPSKQSVSSAGEQASSRTGELSTSSLPQSSLPGKWLLPTGRHLSIFSRFNLSATSPSAMRLVSASICQGVSGRVSFRSRVAAITRLPWACQRRPLDGLAYTACSACSRCSGCYTAIKTSQDKHQDNRQDHVARCVAVSGMTAWRMALWLLLSRRGSANEQEWSGTRATTLGATCPVCLHARALARLAPFRSDLRLARLARLARLGPGRCPELQRTASIACPSLRGHGLIRCAYSVRLHRRRCTSDASAWRADVASLVP